MERPLSSTQRDRDEVLHQPFLFTIAWQMLSTPHTIPIPSNRGQCAGPLPACTCTEAAATPKFDRRLTHPTGSRISLVSCAIHSPLTNTHGHPAKTINMSSRGVYFVTSHPVFVWLPVQVLLRMPRRLARTTPSERIFTGRIREVEWKDVPLERSGSGIELFYSQPTAESRP
ncbi:MAG: hypothetical protein JWO71_1692 [Candidatus Acidoferrum typicum]|nr:hypothetical protein [Candidatus Acidoferrum typicum]